MSADVQVLLWLNGFVGRSAGLDRVASLLVNDYFVPNALALILVLLWFSGRSEKEREAGQRAAAAAAVGAGFSGLTLAIVNIFYYRPRPFEGHELNLLFYQPPVSSFPSTSAAISFALATGIVLGKRRLGLLMLALAFVWGLARVYAGVHYPSDVVVGGALGGVCALLGRGFLRLLEPGPTMVLNFWRRLLLA